MINKYDMLNNAIEAICNSAARYLWKIQNGR